MQRRFIGAHPGVATNQLQLADGHIQRGLVGIFKVQEFLQQRRTVRRLFAQVKIDQAPVAADAVGAVNHRVANVQLRQVLDQRLDIADRFLPLVATADGDAGGEQLGFGDKVDAFFSWEQRHKWMVARNRTKHESAK